ncbi:MAG: hypothetical protein K6F50_02330 [Kiritimatiellae bacterium]|nr:hypothetical protein [Kiritimatiellia bacterium]
MNNKRKTKGAAIACIIAAGAMQITSASPGAETNMDFSAGADLRLRYDGTDNLPTSSRGESKASDYGRFRFRGWMKAAYGDSSLYLRLADEFRAYRAPDSNSRKQRWPDVLFIDSMYFEETGLFGTIDLKIGRQDMSFGAKRLISDGTGGDGSRSAFFDGVRATWHADGKRTLDAFGVYQTADDWLPTLGRTHANNKKPHDYDLNGFKQDEFGIGLYWQDRNEADFGYDLYYVAKGERRGHKSRYRSEGRLSDTHTVGFRLLPRFTKTLSGELELAGQTGSDVKLAGQGYAGVTWEPSLAAKPYLTGACWILSGDADGERGEHAWHAVFNRETGLGESIAPMYSKYSYTNLVYPHVAAGCKIGDFSKLKAQTGPLFTAVKEDDADGSYRGLYAQLKYEISPAKLLGFDILKGGKISFQVECFDKGDWFNDGADHTAIFGRMELAWKF